jgi:hypothetical protein
MECLSIRVFGMWHQHRVRQRRNIAECQVSGARDVWSASWVRCPQRIDSFDVPGAIDTNEGAFTDHGR